MKPQPLWVEALGNLNAWLTRKLAPPMSVSPRAAETRWVAVTLARHRARLSPPRPRVWDADLEDWRPVIEESHILRFQRVDRVTKVLA